MFINCVVVEIAKQEWNSITLGQIRKRYLHLAKVYAWVCEHNGELYRGHV